MHKPPRIESSRLILRPFEMSDAAAVRRLAGDSAIADTTLRIPHPYEEGMAEEWISGHAALYEERREVIFAIVLKVSGELIGSISLSIDRGHESAELGYWIGRPFWNNGYATEAAREVLGCGFGELRLKRIQAHHFTRNPASGRVLEKIGMQHEGCLRRHVKKGGAFEDIVLYGLLREEYVADK
jgi:ribosomal-protein-alanine N-acetyltransferase